MLRARSMRTGVTSVPNADSTLALAGKTTVGRLEQLGDAAGVDRAGAAEREHGDAAQVRALLDRVHPRRRGHVLVDELVDAGRGVGDRQAERVGDRRRAPRSVGGEVERHVAAEEVAGVEQPEREVGVGDRRRGAAAAVARRAGVGAGGLRADLEQAELVDAGEAAAAGADLDEVDRRHRHREARSPS